MKWRTYLPNAAKLKDIFSRFFDFLNRFKVAEKIIIRRSIDGLPSAHSKRMDQKLEQFEQSVHRAERLDAEIVELQQASRTSFRAFRKAHVYLCVHNRLYNRLHSVAYSNHIHVGGLVVFLITLSASVGTLFNPNLRINNQPLFVDYIQASGETDNTLFTGDNNNLTAGFSDKQAKTVGMIVVSESKRVPEASQYQLGLHLLADGLDIPADKQLGDKRVTWQWQRPAESEKAPNAFRLGVAKAQEIIDSSPLPSLVPSLAPSTSPSESVSESPTPTPTLTPTNTPTAQPTADASSSPSPAGQALPASAVANIEVEAPNPELVNMTITPDIFVRYKMEQFKVKETIILKKRSAIKGNTISFSINSTGLVFKEDAGKDGSWQAYREEDKDKPATEAVAVFRLHKPTVEDKDKRAGNITMDIKDGKAIYTIDPHFLNTAAYPIFVDPTITPSGVTRTWDNGGNNGLWATAANWSGDTVPATGDAVVFDSTNYATATAASDTAADDIYSVTLNGAPWGNGAGHGQVAVADTTNGFIYYGTSESPARILKIRASDNAILASLTLNSGENSATAGSVDMVNGFAYFSVASGDRLVKIDLSNFTRTGVITTIDSDNSHSIDTTNGFLYITGNGVEKIQLSNFTKITKITPGGQITSSNIDITGGFLYANDYDNGGRVYKISLSTFTVSSTLTLATAGQIISGEIDTVNGFLYLGLYTTKVAKINLSSFTEVGSQLQLTGGYTPHDSAIDVSGGYVYFASANRIFKIRLSDFTVNTVLTGLNVSSVGNLIRKYMVSTADSLFIGTETSPLQSYKISLATFAAPQTSTAGSSVTLNAHAISSNDGTPDNYKWDLETLTVNSGSLVLVGDTTVNPPVIPTGCSASVKCGRGMEINANTITVASGASINSDAKGFTATTGPGGSSADRNGGAHGGTGGDGYGSTGSGNKNTYGSVTAPTELGSGGGSSGTAVGGGAVKLTVSGTLTNNGTISANGQFTGYASQGAGGSVLISAATLAGSGAIKADGATGLQESGGGGGGRVAVTMTTNSYSGSMTAYGGARCNNGRWFCYAGGNGTVYTKLASQTNGTLTIKNNSPVQSNHHLDGAKLPAGSYAFDSIILNEEGRLTVDTGATLDIRSSIGTVSGDGTGILTHSGSGVLTTDSSLTITNWILEENTSSIGSVTSLTLGSGGVLSHSPNSTAETYKLNLSLTNLTVNSGGKVDVAAKGYGPNYGPGKGVAITGEDSGGASYGGVGGIGGIASNGTPGSTYGSAASPTNIGSGSGYVGDPQTFSGLAYGGGAVQLSISGTLALNSGGTITANGQTPLNPVEVAAPGGGGSGGSVYLIVGTFSGSGSITANGGSVSGNSQYESGGGGGGGRIARYITGSTTYSGTVTVSGGTINAAFGSTAGAAGTNVTQSFPVVSITSPSDGATGQSQNIAIASTSTDPEGDYYRLKLEISTASNYSTSCIFTQTAVASSFSAGTCSGAYSTFAGAFTGMNYDSDATNGSDSYTSGTASTFTFSNDLTQGTTYYYRVSSCDPAGGCGSLSQYGTAVARSFTVAPISRLLFSTSGGDTTCSDASGAQTIVVGQASTVYNVQICNSIDQAVKVTSNQTVALSSNGGNGAFSTTSGGTYTPTLNITINSGASAATFFYKDTSVGTPTITADESPSVGWTAASQQQTVKSDTPTRIRLTISGSPTNTTAGTSLSGTITSYDQYGNTATDFTGDKSIRFNGASVAPGAPGGGTANPTATNKTSTAVAFGTNTTITFANGVGTSTVVLKTTEDAVLSVTDYTSGSAGLTDTSNTYAIQVRPGALNYFGATDYPQQAASQFATAGFPWNNTGLAGGSNAPYDVVITAFDAYSNIKYDYTGGMWFTMDGGKLYAFPHDSVSNAYTFTFNNDYTTHPIRTTTGSTHDNGRHIFDAATFTVTSGGANQNFFLNGTGSIQTTLKINIKPTSIGAIGIAYAPSMTTEIVDTTFNSDVVVTAYDVLGNVKTDYTGSIFFTSSDAGATLPRTSANQYTFVEVDQGTKTFGKATFQFANGGNQTVTVTDNVSDVNNPFTATTNPVVVPVHPTTNVSATAGHQSVTLAWSNPIDPAVTKVNIYQSATNGVLGSKVASPPVSANTVSQYTIPNLTNGTTYYFTLKALHLDPNSAEVESVASTQVSAVPADIAPRNVTASQGADGLVTITYGLRYDSTVSISYFNVATSSWVAASAGAMGGATGAGITGSVDIIPHTATWAAATDYAAKYYTASQGFKVRINVVAQSSNASGVSNNFLLDTNPPRVNNGEQMIIVDATGTNTATLTLLAREDGSPEQAILYRLSNNQDMSGATSYTTLGSKPTTVTGWNLGASSTVYVQYKDPYNNVTSVSNALLNVPANFGLKDGSSLDSNKYRLLLIWDDVTINNFSKYLIDQSTNGTTFTQIDTSLKNGYLNVGLESGTRYYYRVKSQDTAGNISRPTTVLSSQPGAAPDVTAKPTVTLAPWKQDVGVRATVTWSTDQQADSFVVYSKKPLQAGSSTLTTDGEAAQVVGQFDKLTDHEVLLQQLDPSTKYYIKTLSQNEIKITGASDVVEVTTPDRVPLVLSGVKFNETKPTSSLVTWQTNKLSTSVLEYGVTTAYGNKIDDKNLNTDHSILLEGLTSGTNYHVRITGTDSDGNFTMSDDYLLATPAIPVISNLRVSEALADSATITWSTNVNTDSNIEFGPTSAYGSQQGKSDSTTVHSVTIIGLTPATSYTYRAKSKDAFNNEAVSPSTTFTTPKDTAAPVISNVKSEVTTSGTDDNIKIQAIVTWDTDESSTSSAEYGLGLSGDYPNKTQESASLNQSHTVIITDLKPNSSYQYRVVSQDKAGNLQKGEELTIVTPPKNKSLLQLVLKSIEETFAWTKRIKDAPLIKRFSGN